MEYVQWKFPTQIYCICITISVDILLCFFSNFKCDKHQISSFFTKLVFQTYSSKQILFKSGLNISTGHRSISRQKIDLCPTKVALQQTQLSGVNLWKNDMLLKSWNSEAFRKHRPFLLWFFTFMNILIDNLLMQIFIFKTVRCVWVERFYTNILLLFFVLVETASPLKTFNKSLHSTNNLLLLLLLSLVLIPTLAVANARLP